jgi:transposase-like protein
LTCALSGIIGWSSHSSTFKKRVAAEASEPGVTVAQVVHHFDLDARTGNRL